MCVLKLVEDNSVERRYELRQHCDDLDGVQISLPGAHMQLN